MRKFLSNYKSTIILLVAMIVGATLGLILKEKATVLQPFGDLYINLLLVIIVPLIFLTITSSISKMKTPKRLGKIMIAIIGVFVVTSIIAVLVGFLSTYFIKLVDTGDGEQIKQSLVAEEEEETEELNFTERTVKLITVNDFQKLLTKDNIIAVLVAAIICGIAINMTGEKAEPVRKFVESANEVMQNIVKITMYYAPIGIACYFAALVGTFGSTIAVGYLKTFVIYTAVCFAFYFIVYTIYAFIAGGKKGVKDFWKNVLPSTLTALATCSSAASIPVNVENTKKMEVPADIAETTIPLGTSFHKDGSIIGSVFKIMFLVCLFGATVGSNIGVFSILGIALLATLLIAGVPIGGGTISETLIITMLGYPLAALPILTMIATIIDAPATMLNVVGDMPSSMLVARLVEGKEWNKK